MRFFGSATIQFMIWMIPIQQLAINQSITPVNDSIYPSGPSVLTPGKHNITPITACTGYNPAQLIFSTAPTGGLPPYSYQWQVNNLLIPGEVLYFYNPPQLTVAGIYYYNCSITDAAGMVVYTVAKAITIVPDPSVTISGEATLCLNDVVILSSFVTNGTGTLYYQWQSSADNITYTSIAGATISAYSPSTSIAGILYYRVIILPAVGSCNNAISLPSLITVLALPKTSIIYHL